VDLIDTLIIDPAGDTTGMGIGHGICVGGITHIGLDAGIDLGIIPLPILEVV